MTAGIGNASALSEVRDGAVAAIRFAPGDARAYSILGTLEERQGRVEAALALYRHAIALSGTEIHALLQLFSHAAADGRDAEAVDWMDRILRRYPNDWPRVAPVLDALATSAKGETELRKRIALDPPWRNEVLRRLAASPQGTAVAERILLAEHRAGRTVGDRERNIVINAMLHRKASGDAYGFFLATLPGPERQRAGYVFNAGFLPPLSGTAFGWALRRVHGADTVLIDGKQGSGASGLSVAFIGAPTRLGNVSQTMSLPPGGYRLAVTAQATGLVAPKGVFWQVVCANTRHELVRTAIAQGTYPARTFGREFEVPPDCGLQRLVLRTGIETSSWQNRYRGRVVVRAVEISRD